PEAALGVSPMEHPFLEVRWLVTEPQPSARAQIQDAVEGKAVRLVKITRVEQGESDSLNAASIGHVQLDELSLEEVFGRLYRREHGEPPAPELLALLHE